MLKSLIVFFCSVLLTMPCRCSDDKGKGELIWCEAFRKPLVDVIHAKGCKVGLTREVLWDEDGCTIACNSDEFISNRFSILKPALMKMGFLEDVEFRSDDVAFNRHRILKDKLVCEILEPTGGSGEGVDSIPEKDFKELLSHVYISCNSERKK